MKYSTLLIVIGIIAVLTVGAAVGAKVLNNREKRDPEYTNDKTNRKLCKEATVYERYIKRGIDVSAAFVGIVLTAPVVAVAALLIYKEDPGNVIFKQKRIGINKSHFNIHKLRSMKQNTGDIPTHLLSKEDQDNMILRIGRFTRKASIDEFPQFVDILRGRMSLIGPRPALWNQDDLIAERDKYGVNDMRPGLTGLAQISGRDELSIEEKAKLDGEYRKAMRKGSMAGFMMDCKCFFGTIRSVLSSDGVVEGGTGELQANIFSIPAARCHEQLDLAQPKKILIAGEGSYIGESFRTYMQQFANYKVDVFDSKSDCWRDMDFSQYDVVYDVAGIAHVKETDQNRDLYYKVNRDLAIDIAKKAKAEGIRQFIYLSSMSVYGLVEGRIDKDTRLKPVNAYGKSKLEAEKLLWELRDDAFVVSIVRPPMVYGDGCKGNYQTLRKFALKYRFFTKYTNERSMLYIDNLSSAIRGIIHNSESGLYFPQDSDYVQTYEMVKGIATQEGKKFRSTRIFNPIIKLMSKRVNVFKKVFGTLTYEKDMNVPLQWMQVEGKTSKKKALMIASMGSMLDNFNRTNIYTLEELGYDVTLAANFVDEDSNSKEKNDSFVSEMKQKGYRIVQIDFSRSISNVKKQMKSVRQVKVLLKEDFALVHCHSPICAAIVRLAYNKYRKVPGHKVIYTAHGFHFYDGASKLNWMMFYPVEKKCSKLTDVLITINREDYNRARDKFKARETEYIPGVGIDTNVKCDLVSCANKRQELNIPSDEFMLISVGELNKNKNHEVVIKALAKINNPKIHYCVAGVGKCDAELIELAKESNVDLRLLGFRTDIGELLATADAFVFPSFREGLSVALMEAMAAGLPCIVSNIRGNSDLITPDKGGYLLDPIDVDGFANQIKKLVTDQNKCNELGEYNLERIKQFDTVVVNQEMRRIYTAIV